MKEFRIGVVGNVDSGKCLSPETPVIQYNSKIVPVEQIKLGDYLMGDDSTPRKVMKIYQGETEMYKIQQIKGDDYIVTQNHILTLKFGNPSVKVYKNKFVLLWHSGDGKIIREYFNTKEAGIERAKIVPNIQILDISVKDYITKTQSWKSMFYGYSVPISYSPQSVDLDPYFLGIMLGDNSLYNNNNNKQLKQKKQNDLEYLSSIKNRAPTLFNSFSDIIDKYGLNDNNKYIPDKFLNNTENIRNNLLAGLIDSNGYLYNNNNYEILHKNKLLASQIIILTRSLGFRTNLKIITNKNHNHNSNNLDEDIYYCIRFSGENINKIPIVLEHKKITKNISKNNNLMTTIKVTKAKYGKYYGFELDGNGRFLLGDNTVTHNSSLIGVLKTNINDDGRGSARKHVMKHPHELESGRTSCVSYNHININNNNVIFIDLAGHLKYFKTTIYGLSSLCLDLVILVISSNQGISDMTREHYLLSRFFRLPTLIVITKIDICPQNILKETIDNIEKYVKSSKGGKRNINIIDNTKQIDYETLFNNNNIINIIQISNKSGYNIDTLKNIIYNFKIKNTYEDKINNDFIKFNIEEIYQVPGIGIVLYGILVSGTINIKDKLKLGLFKDGSSYDIIVKSMHDNNKNNIEKLYAGQTGCIAIKSTNNKIILKRNLIKKGMYIVNYFKTYTEFKCNLYILHHSTTIKTGFEPIINTKCISQVGRIESINNDKILRTGDNEIVKFKFKFKPEIIDINQLFVLRDAQCKAVGKILELY